MKGIHHVSVANSSMKYEFDVKRNITILKGDSATGKTTLVEMIQEYLINGLDSGINFSCDVECRVLTGNLWKEQVKTDGDAIMFIDEGNRFIRTKEFAEIVRETGNYFIIVTRESLEMLPISVDEIYGIKSSGKYGSLTPVYHEFYKIYELDKTENYPICPNILLTEDSNSGYEFFHGIAKDNDIECISANGKSNIYQYLCDYQTDQELLIIADGAAFGSQMNRIERIVSKNPKMHLYLPESFEWLLLSAKLFRETAINEMLDSIEDYIEYKDYFSAEQYFTSYLVDVSRDTYLQYHKQKLNPNYLQSSIKKKVLEAMKNIEL